VSGDGCRSDCSLIEAGWDCTTGTCYQCGNGNVDPGEDCDDGNAQGGDGCSADCKTTEPSYNCPVAGQLCEQCGNGIREANEECDDGNTVESPVDGCSATCTVEPGGWQCVFAGQPCDLCGNGDATTNEICDDDNTEDGDGCAADCQSVEQWYTCPAGGGACSYDVVCGDGRIGDD